MRAGQNFIQCTSLATAPKSEPLQSLKGRPFADLPVLEYTGSGPLRDKRRLVFNVVDVVP